MDGTAKMEWMPKAQGRRFLFVPGGVLGGVTPAKREDDVPNKDAPYVVPGYPNYSRNIFEVTLPSGMEGFGIEGEDVDKTIAGRRLVRKSKVEGGVARVETSVRTLAPEFPASEAKAAGDALTEMGRVRVAIRAPNGYRPTPDDIAAWATETPKTANDYIGRATRYMAVGRDKETLADLDKAAELDPKSAWPAANKAGMYVSVGKPELAAPEIAKALELDPRNFVAIQAQGAIAMQDGRLDDAVAAYSRASDLQPRNLFALYQRHIARRMQGQFEKAMADLDEIEKLEPGLAETHVQRMQLFAAQGDWTRALSEVDAAIAKRPEEPNFAILKGALLARANRRPEAMAVFDAAVAKAPSAALYVNRAQTRAKDDITGRLADLAQAEKLDPKTSTYPVLRTRYLTDAGRHDQAIATATRALGKAPADPPLLFARARAYVRAGKPALATQDFAALRRQASKSAVQLNSLCWEQATLGVDFEAALSDCDAALAISPRNAPALDSRAFVLMRLGRLDEALRGYDSVMKLRGDYAESLYGRGVARLRLGQEEAGRADIAAAKRIRPDIDEVWTEYGIAAPPPAAGKQEAAATRPAV